MFERQRQGAVDVIHGTTPLVHDNLQEFLDVMQLCLRSGQPRLVLDLRRVPLLDSAGLETLLDCRERCRAIGGQLKLAAPNHLCNDILAVTGVAESFEIFADVVAAAGSFAK